MSWTKEKITKIFIIILAILFAIFLALNLYLQKSLVVSSAGFLASISVFLALEMYLRIQHNIDNKFNENVRKINDVRNGIALMSKNFNERVEDEASALKDNFENRFAEKIAELTQRVAELTQRVAELDESFNDRFMKIIDDNEGDSKKIDSIAEKINIFREDHKKITDKIHKDSSLIGRFYWSYVKEKRALGLLKLAPDIFNHKSVLYIGAKKGRHDFLEDFQKSGCNITVLEIFKQNAEDLKGVSWISEVIEGDVCNFFTDKKFDVIFWWHGPEHIKEEKLAMTLKKLESFANNCVILGCPWGNVSQKIGVDENPFEEHVSFFNEGYFESLGYKTDYSGVKDTMGSNILSVKKVK